MIFVKHILDTARARLAVLKRAAPVSDAAKILANPNTPLIVVCDEEGIAVGVLTRTDIVKLLAAARPDVCSASVDTIMTKLIVSCHLDQPAQEVWTTLKDRTLRCAPILDAAGQPQGVIHARDLALALLDEEAHEELLLRDYVLGIGYQ